MKKILYTFLALTLVLCSAKAQISVDNNFESTLTPWAISGGTPTLSTADFHSGASSAYFAPNAGTYCNAWAMLEPNKNYHYSFWIKTTNPGELKIEHMPGDAYAISGATKIVPDGNGAIGLRGIISYSGIWELVSVNIYTGTCGGEAGNMTIGYWGNGSYFDDMKVERYDSVFLVTSIAVTGAGNATEITTDAGTLQMSATVLPANASNNAVVWSVENGTGEASISETGLLTASKNGTVTVKATAVDASAVVGQTEITISGQIIIMPVESITVTGENDATEITTDAGTLQMSAAVLPVDANNKDVSWSVENMTGEATISATGLLTASKNGTVKVKATAKDGSAVAGDIIITISNQVGPILVESITVAAENEATDMTIAGGPLQMLATVLPENAANKDVVWSVENMTGMATISSTGSLTAIKTGTVKVIATAADASAKVGEATITIKGSIVFQTSFEAGIDPFAANDGAALWSDDAHSGSKSVNFPAGKGTWSSISNLLESNKFYHFSFWIKSSAPGELKLDHMPSDAYAKFGDVVLNAAGDNISGQRTIDLKPAITLDGSKWVFVSFDLYSGSSSLYSGFASAGNFVVGWWGTGSYIDDWKVEEFQPVILVNAIVVTGANNATTITENAGTLQMSAAVLPENADNKDVTWSVVNGTGEASISALGLLTASANGTVTVKATAKDASAIVGTLTVTISGQGTGIADATAQYSIYPNPATDQLNISASAKIAKVEIISVEGKVILSVNANDNNLIVPVAALKNGLYLIRISEINGTVKISKFEKE